jgi:hypothetical protein
MDLNIVIPTILFVVLSPGVFVALPPGGSAVTVIATHAAIFALVYWGLRRTFPAYY